MTDETHAVEILKDAGLVTAEDDGYYEVDKIFSGRPEAVKFLEEGDFITGQVVEAFARQKTAFGTNDPVYHDDGSPKLEAAIVLNTPDGLRTLYVSSWRMEKALSEAFAVAGVRGPRRGGNVYVKFVAFGDPYKPGAPPPKEYEAAYDSPEQVAGGQAWTATADDIRGKNQVRQALPPARPGQLLISGECAGNDCRACSDSKCTHECHRASKVPALPEGEPGEVPF